MTKSPFQHSYTDSVWVDWAKRRINLRGQPEKFLTDDVSLPRPVTFPDWLLHGFEFSRESNNQSETIHYPYRFRHQYRILRLNTHSSLGPLERFMTKKIKPKPVKTGVSLIGPPFNKQNIVTSTLIQEIFATR